MSSPNKNPESTSSSTQTADTTDPDKVFKTPISTLQEYCQKLGKTPQYDLTALEGRMHQPQFVYRCMVGDVVASGQGGSKKQAKQAAAEAVLKELTADLLPADAGQAREKKLTVATVTPSGTETDDTNPVGSLQELVVARGWRIPVYSLAHETGPAHKKEFIVCCVVESFKEYGSGSAKKHAKRLAASNMYHRLMNLPPEAKENVSSQSREAKSKVLLNEINNSLGERLCNLAIDSDTTQACQALENLAKAYKFEVTYKDIDCKTTKEEVQCFVEINTQPVMVLPGCGKSFTDAHENAAKYALHFLKTCTTNNSVQSET